MEIYNAFEQKNKYGKPFYDFSESVEVRHSLAKNHEISIGFRGYGFVMKAKSKTSMTRYDTYPDYVGDVSYNMSIPTREGEKHFSKYNHDNNCALDIDKKLLNKLMRYGLALDYFHNIAYKAIYKVNLPQDINSLDKYTKAECDKRYNEIEDEFIERIQTLFDGKECEDAQVFLDEVLEGNTFDINSEQQKIVEERLKEKEIKYEKDLVYEANKKKIDEAWENRVKYRMERGVAGMLKFVSDVCYKLSKGIASRNKGKFYANEWKELKAPNCPNRAKSDPAEREC